MRRFSRAIPILLAMALASPAAAEFKLTFKSWGDIPACTSGNPNRVGNPEFVFSGVPAGTTSIQFQMKDLDAPGYNHGGSKRLAATGDGKLPLGSFTYKSPCPPGGVHTYEWTATARNGNKVLAKAKAQRRYPE
ncbi:YbhB/YbcL family Raf kinase inhibitor-like protein [Pseudodonghicola flavimaris]|uniref:YbhB/YbcL family Raf kinase inhibitor-like protein n=1 Tax=Pseudodonghicola flavimaris TaxID=3050036 RepID=A0ABT7EZ77_9RHOB|nr:YbhB/YbcL family Raf kinase inhibitor-like protein [Pseudodonghicola flavimaris]MDK3017664.1 YbhB/YbcL family Raf kinase inhibitor-like protein [Pseudodonghicola flavimaris]